MVLSVQVRFPRSKSAVPATVCFWADFPKRSDTLTGKGAGDSCFLVLRAETKMAVYISAAELQMKSWLQLSYCYWIEIKRNTMILTGCWAAVIGMEERETDLN